MAGGKRQRKTSFPFWKSQRDPSVQEDAPSISWFVSHLSGWDQKPGFNADIASSPTVLWEISQGLHKVEHPPF